MNADLFQSSLHVTFALVEYVQIEKPPTENLFLFPASSGHKIYFRPKCSWIVRCRSNNFG